MPDKNCPRSNCSTTVLKVRPSTAQKSKRSRTPPVRRAIHRRPALIGPLRGLVNAALNQACRPKKQRTRPVTQHEIALAPELLATRALLAAEIRQDAAAALKRTLVFVNELTEYFGGAQ